MKTLLLVFFHFFALFASLCLFSTPLVAQEATEVLTVSNPQQNWFLDQGTIEEATFTVRPRGVYAEVGVYLTFSANGASFSLNEALEVVFTFSLPEGASVIDSWLWVGDDIVKAILIDRWTATEVYEGIVNRRRDPSLLTKLNDGAYELRVYPLAAGSTRRVKITYLVPMEWTREQTIAQLPFHWLQTSRHPVEDTFILAWPDDQWHSPFLTEAPELEVKEGMDPDRGAFRQIEVGPDLTPILESISFSSPLKNGVFLSTYGEEGSGWFQLAVLPSEVMSVGEARKVAVLVDYDAAKSTLSSTTLLETARSVLKSMLAPSDSFNVIVSRLEVDPVSSMWLPAEPAVIDAAFDEALATVPSSYSNLPTLLVSGLNFIGSQATSNQGSRGEILLVSSADGITTADVANQLIQDLQTVLSPLPAIHVADVADRDVSVNTIGPVTYSGNAYLYSNLARVSGGQYAHVRSGRSYEAVLRELLSGLGGAIRNPDLYTTVAGGFTYNRFTSADGEDAVPLHVAVTQTGNFIGALPFVVEGSWLYDGEAVSNQITLGEQEIAVSDSSLKVYWTGQQIQKLEHTQPDDEVIAEIIDYSLQSRILSLYTAFLALEPGVMDTEPCTECDDETEVLPIAVEETDVPGATIELEAYPNPFSSRVTIRIVFPELTDLGNHTFEIYNSMGQVVKTFQVNASNGRIVELVWDGTNEAGEPVSSGVYFFVMTSPEGRYTLQLVRVR